MKIYKQVSYIINLIYQSKKEIFLILLLINGLGILYFKNIEKKYYANIIITAIPNLANIQPVDVFSMFEIFFRNVENFEQWKNLNTNKNQKILVENIDISGYQINNEEVLINNKLVFKNAITLQRSIYLVIPAENPIFIKNIFLYSQFIENKLNSLEYFQPGHDQFRNEDLELIRRLFLDSYTPRGGEALEIDKLIEFYKKLNDFKYELKLNEEKANNLPIVKISPPNLIYTNSISLNQVLFSSILISILLVCVTLLIKDFKKSLRN